MDHQTSQLGARRRRVGPPAVRALVAVGAVGLLAAGLAGCASGSDTTAVGNAGTIARSVEGSVVGPPRDGGELRFGLATETNSWNPSQGQWSASSFLVGNAVFDPLVAFDDDAVPHPYLAASLTHAEDYTSWDIGIREGVRFHDGSVLDAAAVAANLEAARTSGLTAVAFATVTGVDAVDASTVRVTMSAPFATFPLVLAGQPGYVAAPSQLADPDGARHPVGTGPFRLSEWVPDQHLTVTRNPDYWRAGLPHLDGVDFRIVPDGQSRSAAFASGQLDAIEATTAEAIAEGEARARQGAFQFFSDAGRETDELIITLNTSTTPFDDPVAREAVAAAIDRDAIASVNGGAFPAAWGPLAEGSPAYLSPEEAGNTPHDPARARQLADEYAAAHGGPLTFTVLLPPDPVLSSTAQLIQAQMTEAGIDVRIEAIEQSSMVGRVLGGDYQASGFALFSTPTLDRAYAFIATPVPAQGLSLNMSRYEDPELTAAMDRARATEDPQARADAYRDVQRRLAAGNQLVFLSHRLRAIEYANGVHGIDDTTVPGVDTVAYAGLYTSPFLTATWMEAR